MTEHKNSLARAWCEQLQRYVTEGEIGFYKNPVKCCIDGCNNLTYAYELEIMWSSFSGYQFLEHPLCPKHLKEHKKEMKKA